MVMKDQNFKRTTSQNLETVIHQIQITNKDYEKLILVRNKKTA